jgi:hypothetical protein
MGIVHIPGHYHPNGEIREDIEQFLLNREKHPFLLLPLLTLHRLKVNQYSYWPILLDE